MKKIFRKTNELWLRLRNWGKVNLFGYFIVSLLKIFFIIFIFLLTFCILSKIGSLKKDKEIPDSAVSDSTDTTDQNCTITGINLHGTLLTYIPDHADNDSSFNYDVTSSENITWSIKQANEDPKIKAIVIETDSGGGSPVAGEEISNAVKNSLKPVIALIRGSGDSSAYLSISSAKRIFASKYSDVGSIGITASYVNNSAKDKTDGYTFEQLSSGKYKDMGSVDKPLTKDERNLYMRDINIMYGNFVEAVSQNRNIPLEKVKSFADGSTVLGEKAKELGLIDEIGGLPEVENYLQKITGEKPEICWQ